MRHSVASVGADEVAGLLHTARVIGRAGPAKGTARPLIAVSSAAMARPAAPS